MPPAKIDVNTFDFVIRKLREFCMNEGLKEACVQHHQSILAACEDPFTISTYCHGGNVWPLPQTGQMELEKIMLNESNSRGYYTLTTSYRNEPNIIEGRHHTTFPMFEVEIDEDMNGLIDFEKRMLAHLGFDLSLAKQKKWNDTASYLSCKGLNDIGNEEEHRIWKEISPIFFLTHFPLKTSPFWNMKLNDVNKEEANKVDVILYGMETIGSAERSCNPKEMRDMFHTISDGKYAEKLNFEFTKERVESELDEYLNSNFRKRSGFGMGLTRLIRAMELANLLPEY